MCHIRESEVNTITNREIQYYTKLWNKWIIICLPQVIVCSLMLQRTLIVSYALICGVSEYVTIERRYEFILIRAVTLIVI